jgi:hypothetical protein
MNRDQRWIVNAFQTALEDLKPFEVEPAHRVDMRLQLAEMVLAEVAGDDPEELANRADAEAVRDLYLSTNPNAKQRYVEVRSAHLELLKSLSTPTTD